MVPPYENIDDLLSTMVTGCWSVYNLINDNLPSGGDGELTTNNIWSDAIYLVDDLDIDKVSDLCAEFDSVSVTDEETVQAAVTSSCYVNVPLHWLKLKPSSHK